MPGLLFKITSLGVSFFGSAGLLAVVLSISGVQYTWGRICYLIPRHDNEVFWWPLLGVSIASLLLQFATIAYCVVRTVRPWFHYCKLRWQGRTPSADEERLISALHTASKVRKIVQMQWRAILITVLILGYVCYLAAVLMRLHEFHDYPESDRLAWFKCLASPKGGMYPCLSLARNLGPSEPELFAVLFMLQVSLLLSTDSLKRANLSFQLSGLLAIAILSRSSMYRAWKSLLKGEKQQPVIPARHWADSPTLDVQREDEPDEEIGTQTSYRFSELTATPSSETGSLVKSKTLPRPMT